VIRVYDEASNVIETHEHKGDFKAIADAYRIPMVLLTSGTLTIGAISGFVFFSDGEFLCAVVGPLLGARGDSKLDERGPKMPRWAAL
jgi:hypothetical protein